MDVSPTTFRRRRRRLIVCLAAAGLLATEPLAPALGFDGLHPMALSDDIVRLGEITGLADLGADRLPPPRILRTGSRVIQVPPLALNKPAVDVDDLAQLSEPDDAMPRPSAPVIETPLPPPSILRTAPTTTVVDVEAKQTPIQDTATASIAGQPVGPETIIPEIFAANQSSNLLGAVAQQQLHDHARAAIATAQQRLQRGAIFTAQKMAMDSLRHIASSKDLAAGTNRYGKSLSAAMTAIRESRDFASTIGMADVETIKRLVQSHQTPVLKGSHLDAMSSLKATEMYLGAANEVLVNSFSDVPAAAEALVLLGNVEKRTGSDNPMHAGAVALTLHQAASRIGTNNGIAYRELGTTLMQQGMSSHALEAFRRSVSLNPVRGNYRNLMEASRRVGDLETMQVCQTILQRPDIASDLPVKQLSVSEFTKTYRPVSHRTPSPQVATAAPKETANQENEKPKRKSWFSIFKR